MSAFYLSLAVWFALVVAWAFLVEPYKQLKPVERIQRGYLLWNENFTCNQNRSRLDIHLRGLIRYWITGPANFEKKLRKANIRLRNLEQIDPHRFYLTKKNGKLRL